MEISLLHSLPLFQGVDLESIGEILTVLHSVEAGYPAECILLHPGETTSRFGILLEGKIKIWKEDYRGNATLLAQVEPVDLFAEAFAWSGERLTVSVETALPSRVLWLDSRQFFQAQAAAPPLGQVQQNLLWLLAGKNVFLTGRIEHLSKRTLREKLLSYLSEQAFRAGSLEFAIPMNRQELADFLAADRSALSAVLSGLQKEGILEYRKNHFVLCPSRSHSFLEHPGNLDG